MDDYSIALGNAVKEARTESKLTQEQIADMLDIDSRTISQIERGLGNPKVGKRFTRLFAYSMLTLIPSSTPLLRLKHPSWIA